MTASQAEVDDSEVAEWECPFCGYTNEKVRGVRSHINSQTDDPHQGESGWDTILKGYDEDGELIVGDESISEIKKDLSKHDRILNAWVANPGADNGEIADVAGASEGYASSINRELKQGEIPTEEVEDVRNEKLVVEFRKRLGEPDEEPEWYQALQQAISGDGEESPEESEAEEVEEPAETEEEPEESAPVDDETVNEIEDELTKKDRIINAWIAKPDSNNSEIADVAGASEGYASSINRELKLGERTTQDVLDTMNETLVEAYRAEIGEPDEEPEWFTDLQDAMAGEQVEEEEPEESVETEEEPEPEPAPEPSAEPEVESTTETAASPSEQPKRLAELREQRLVEGVVEDEAEAQQILDQWNDVQAKIPAGEVAQVRNQLVTLLNEAEYEKENADSAEDRRVGRAKFYVANQAVTLLDDILEGGSETTPSAISAGD